MDLLARACAPLAYALASFLVLRANSAAGGFPGDDLGVGILVLGALVVALGVVVLVVAAVAVAVRPRRRGLAWANAVVTAVLVGLLAVLVGSAGADLAAVALGAAVGLVPAVVCVATPGGLRVGATEPGSRRTAGTR